jgi:hypothetical protein
MGDITVTAANVRALQANGAIVRNYTAGGSINVGDAVYIASDGDVEQADGSADSTAFGIGIAVEGYDETTAIASGEPVSVCVLGPVSGFSGATPGSKGWISDTAGQLGTAAGSSAHELGYFESATIFFVNPDAAGAGS